MDFHWSGTGGANACWRAQFKRSLSFLKAFRLKISFVLFLLLLITGLGVAEPLVYGYIFDRLWDKERLSQTAFGVALLCGIGILREIVGGYSNWLSWKIRLDLKGVMYDAVVGKLLSLPLSYHSQHTVGGQMTRLDRGVNGVVDALAEVGLNLIPGTAYLIFSLVVMFRMDWRLAAVVLVFAPIPALIGMRAAEEQTRRDAGLIKRWEKLFSRFCSILGGIRTVKSFAMNDEENRRFVGQVNDIHAVVVSGVATDTRTGGAKNLAMLAARISSIGFGAYLAAAGDITPGTVLAFIGYQGGLFGPVQGLTGIYQVIRRASVSLSIVYSILDEAEQAQASAGYRGVGEVSGEIAFHDVSFSYSNGRSVLQEISIDVRPGEVVALVGPSGAGKTTLISLLLRFYDPCQGSITLDGVDIRTIDKMELRRQIGVVLQDGSIFSDTVASNISYGSNPPSFEAIETVAKGAHAHDFIMKMPHGYDTVLGEFGFSISAGERQRILIARALLKDPPILILDEATSSLDAESEALVQDALLRLIRKRTTFIIAHRLATVAWADRIIVLKGGRIIEDDTPETLLNRGGYYSTVVQLQEQRKKTAPETVL